MDEYLKMLIEDFNETGAPEFMFKFEDKILKFYLDQEPQGEINGLDEIPHGTKHYEDTLTCTINHNEIFDVYLIIKNYESYLMAEKLLGSFYPNGEIETKGGSNNA